MPVHHRLDPDQRPYDVANLPLKPHTDVATLLALDVRVGTIVDAEPLPTAHQPTLVVTATFGPLIGTRRSCAKIANYPAETLVGRRIVAIMNLEPRRIAGVVSEFLVLGGLEADGTVRLLSVDGDLHDGAVVA